MKLIPAIFAEHTVESLYATHGPERPWIYWLLLLGAGGALASLPLIKVDVTVRAPGMIRPASERAELRPAVTGRIDRVLARDNDPVKAEQPLLVLDAGELDERLARNRAQQAMYAASISDLGHLISSAANRPVAAIAFLTPALRQELAQHTAQLDSCRLAETKARNELARHAALAAKGIATQQELDNARYEVARLQAEFRLLEERALARWQARLRDEQITLADLVSEQQRLLEESTRYTVRAPADGVLVDFIGWNAGGFLTAGQSLGIVSPSDTLLVDTHVSPRDVGLVRVGQAARLQIDAYPYTQWGMLDGTVEAISGDLAGGGGNGNNTPAFKVTIRPATGHLSLPNGTRGELRNGLTLSARFRVARRSVFQLLYDDVSAWLNPQHSRPAT
jgi:multidrug resistance efflux pump